MKRKKYKIGILYAKENQTIESEILKNNNPSELFINFLQLIATKVRLQDFRGYAGDLDVQRDNTGKYSWYTKLHNEFEIMFHVSTEIPSDPNDDQQIARKKFIGNDLIMIIFQEGGAFTPPCISGDFLQVFAVVQPIIEEENEEEKQIDQQQQVEQEVDQEKKKKTKRYVINLLVVQEMVSLRLDLLFLVLQFLKLINILENFY